MRHTPNKTWLDAKESSSQKGAILILLLFSLTAIIGFLALGIDATRMNTASTEQKAAVRTAALAALQAYRNAEPNPSDDPQTQYKQRLTEAMERAEEVLSLEANAGLFGYWAKGRHFLSDSTLAVSDASRVSEDGLVVGQITPGTYYREAPESCGLAGEPACPCVDSEYPCFVKNQLSDTQLTAVEVDISSADDQRFLGTFTAVMHKMITGEDSAGTKIKSVGRASFSPRVAVYGIDLSRSISFDTHIDAEFEADGTLRNPGTAAEYVYELDVSDAAAPRCAGGNNYTNPCLDSVSNSYNNSQGCRMRIASTHAVYYETTRTRPATLGAETQHYRDDYACYLLNVNYPNGTSEERHFLIDVSIHDLANGEKYYGPQPLTDILKGLGSVTETLNKEAIPGDQIGLFGFDNSILEARTLGPSDPFSTSNSDWEKFNQLVDVESLVDNSPGQAGLKLRIEELLFFPFPTAQTDFPLTVFKAAELFPDLPQADMQLTLFSDFLGNCLRWGVGGDFIRKNADIFDLSTPDCKTPRISNDRFLDPWDNNSWTHHIIGMEQAAIVVGGARAALSPELTSGQIQFTDDPQKTGYDTFASRDIRVNTVILGDAVGAHSLLKKSKSEPNTCMREEEARSEGVGLAFSYPYRSAARANAACIFMQQGFPECQYIGAGKYAYAMSESTGGFYLPIRPSCDLTEIANQTTWNISEAACQSGALEDRIDSEICAPSNSTSNDGLTNPELGTINKGGATYTQLEAANVIAKGVSGARFVQSSSPARWEMLANNYDTNGKYSSRVTCDTRCRDIAGQVADAIKGSFKVNPYAIVRDDT